MLGGPQALIKGAWEVDFGSIPCLSPLHAIPFSSEKF
jgi:hypothetical protein